MPCDKNTSEATTIRNGLTIDVEDYFQVSAFENHIRRDDWHRIPCRIERNMDRILAVLDQHEIRATFFTLGWIAERFPRVARTIADSGHELASHGYEHIRVSQQKREEFRQDILRAKHLLEDIGGIEVQGYRAASYSINESNLWAHDELAEAGYRYSSSIYPIRHDLYGMPTAPRFVYQPLKGADFLEVPITTTEVFGRRLPCGGGGYFRLFPYPMSRWALRRVNRSERRPGVFYFHPWEIDPEQPKQQGLSVKTRFRHYCNLQRMENRLQRLFTDFQWDSMANIFPVSSPVVPENLEDMR
jgi:polysaccharide deacetylase family protein (PEP-CTERM system associated)